MVVDYYVNHSHERRARTIESDLGSPAAGVINVLARGTGQIISPHGLTHNDFTLLTLLLGAEECTATQLAQVLKLATSSISRSVTKLVDMGLVQRRRLLSDRRVVILSMTEKGIALTHEIHGRIQEYDARLCEGVSEEQKAVYAAVNSMVMANHAAMAQPAGS